LFSVSFELLLGVFGIREEEEEEEEEEGRQEEEEEADCFENCGKCYDVLELMLFIVLPADDINAFAIVLDCGCLCGEELVCFSKEIFAVFPFFSSSVSLDFPARRSVLRQSVHCVAFRGRAGEVLIS